MRILPLFIVTITTLPYYVYSFCVYNQHTDGTSFFVREVGGFGSMKNKAFAKDRIRPGGKECCNYNNKDCVIGRNPNAIVKFYIHRFTGDNHGIDNYEITCPGGGYVVLGGTSGGPSIDVRWGDGSSFPYERNTNVKSNDWHTKLNGTRTITDDEENPGVQNKTEGTSRRRKRVWVDVAAK